MTPTVVNRPLYITGVRPGKNNNPAPRAGEIGILPSRGRTSAGRSVAQPPKAGSAKISIWSTRGRIAAFRSATRPFRGRICENQHLVDARLDGCFSFSHPTAPRPDLRKFASGRRAAGWLLPARPPNRPQAGSAEISIWSTGGGPAAFRAATQPPPGRIRERRHSVSVRPHECRSLGHPASPRPHLQRSASGQPAVGRVQVARPPNCPRAGSANIGIWSTRGRMSAFRPAAPPSPGRICENRHSAAARSDECR